MKINQPKLEVHDPYKKVGEIATNFEAVDNEDVRNKTYLDEKLKNCWTYFIYRKRLQQIQITVQQTICRREFSSKS